MELIRDQGYEDWGDCRGRAWCATCHIKINHSNIYLSTDIKEQIRIDGLTNTILSSRLACQIALDKKIHQAEVEFIGAD